MSRAFVLLSMLLLVGGCSPSSSGVDPAKNYENITEAEVDALCRWQEDVMGTEPVNCGWGDVYFDYESCVATPPLGRCSFHTVEQFEDCRRAMAEEPCDNFPPSCYVWTCV